MFIIRLLAGMFHLPHHHSQNIIVGAIMTIKDWQKKIPHQSADAPVSTLDMVKIMRSERRAKNGPPWDSASVESVYCHNVLQLNQTLEYF